MKSAPWPPWCFRKRAPPHGRPCGETDGRRQPGVNRSPQNLTLPISRMALVLRHDAALAAYPSCVMGWLVLSSAVPDQSQRAHEHVPREWPAEGLKPPATETFPGVAREIIDFVERCVARA